MNARRRAETSAAKERLKIRRTSTELTDMLHCH